MVIALVIAVLLILLCLSGGGSATGLTGDSDEEY
jgi:hypothetical protein